MKKALSRSIYLIGKIGLMVLLFSIIKNRFIGLFDGPTIMEIMSILWTVVGMNVGLAAGIALFSKIRMPRWLLGILLLVFVVLGSFFVEKLMMWVYGLIFAMFAKILAIIFSVIMILGISGLLYYVIMYWAIALFIGMQDN